MSVHTQRLLPHPPPAVRPPRGPATRAAALCAAVLAAAVLAGCGTGGGTGGGPSGGKEVDSLAGGSPGAGGARHGAGAGGGASSDAVQAKRPQLRLDTSEEESARLTDAYHACLQAHGVPMNTQRAAAAGQKQAWPLVPPGQEDRYRPAYDACLVKLPRQPPETSPRTNPHYADDYRTYVKCLKKHGMKIHMVPDTSVYSDGLGWTYDSDATSSLPESEQPGVERNCTTEAFGGRR
ncbi:hypothetical protein GCM10018793_51650 [Streptomyces sulfonofaciens]|uniref:Uncharacterized protein n=1 Tax=Streptomyces sulfonofaciens TaxID=68272 RepID=A0A919L5V6_9ACTN|nr:hypothetical protein [Streptomyces sulfonofaciens]GHH85077.1 hypothetical protein GCM10018793_51650 [Streptomyces sulfonofaciens]